MHVRRRSAALLSLPLIVAAMAGGPASALAGEPSDICGTGADTLGNGGFETPGVEPGNYALYDAALVTPWLTTDAFGQIEIWADGYGGVPAFEGTHFAELNANSAGTLYQDVVTTPGATMTWTLAHRARQGTDVMTVLIGDPATADASSDAGWDVISEPISNPDTAWGAATGTYVVPDGRSCTRFAFRAVSTGSGDASVGNFLDAIGFEVTIPAGPTPTPSGTAVATGGPAVTPPWTDTLDAASTAAAGPGNAMALVAVVAGWCLLLAGLGLLTARRARRVR